MSRKQKKTDVSRLVKSIDLSSLGFGPTLCERMENIVCELGSCELEKGSLQQRLKITPSQLQPALQALLNLGVIKSRRNFASGATRKEARKPNAYCLLSTQLKKLANTQPANRKPGAVFDSLSMKRTQQLRALVENWQSAGFKSQKSADLAAMVIAVIGTVRSVKPADLACELPLGESTIKRALSVCRELGYLDSELNYDDWPGRGPNTWRVKWQKVPAGSKRHKGLGVRIRTLRISRRPQTKHDQLSREQRRILKAALLQSKVLRTPEQRQNVGRLVGVVGIERVVKIKDLAIEMSVSESGLNKIASLARRAMFLDRKYTRNTGSRGARTKWIVPWPKIESLADVEMKAGPKQQKKNRAHQTLRKTTSGGQKPHKRNRTCEWIENWRTDNPENSLEQARRAYVAQFPQDIISLDALKKAIRRRRSNAV